jgi:four helix bundle protein
MTLDVTGFRNLLIWQKAQELALSVSRETAKLPRSRNVDVNSNQVLRSSGSVSANIAEGHGRFYQAAYRNHLSIARGSLFETESWIDLLFKDGSLSEEINRKLVEQCHELARLLSSPMIAMDKNPRIREESGAYEV